MDTCEYHKQHIVFHLINRNVQTTNVCNYIVLCFQHEFYCSFRHMILRHDIEQNIPVIKENSCPLIKIETREDFVKTHLGSVEFTRNSKASVLSFIDG